VWTEKSLSHKAYGASPSSTAARLARRSSSVHGCATTTVVVLDGGGKHHEPSQSTSPLKQPRGGVLYQVRTSLMRELWATLLQHAPLAGWGARADYS
jgi:hypothetical protein